MRKFFEDLRSGIILLNESLEPVKYMSTLLLISVSPELLPMFQQNKGFRVCEIFLIIKVEF